MLTTTREYLPVTWTADVELDEQVVEIGIRLSGEDDIDWHPAEWVGDAGTTRDATILVGPGGAPSVGELPVGVHRVFSRLTDTPEVPVLRAYLLTIKSA